MMFFLSHIDDFDLPDLSQFFRELTPDPPDQTDGRSASDVSGPSGFRPNTHTVGGPLSSYADSHPGSVSSVPSLPPMLSPLHLSLNSPSPSGIEIPTSPMSTTSAAGPSHSHRPPGVNPVISTDLPTTHHTMRGSQRPFPLHPSTVLVHQSKQTRATGGGGVAEVAEEDAGLDHMAM
jgi:hypothetical protein